MKKVKKQIKKTASGLDAKERENFIAIMKEKDPEAYQVALEKGWLDSILMDIGVGHKKPDQSNITSK